MHRRTFLAAAGATLGAGALGTPAAGQSATVGLEPVASGFASPLDVTAGDGTLFVADQPGVLYRIESGEPDPALDLRERTVSLNDGYDERGLLGAAFHPDYPDDDRLFVRYSAPRREGTPENYSHTFVLASFAAPGGDPDPDSETTLLEIPQPQSNHNAGSLAFGPDGYLYVGVGDGGGANDEGRGHVADWYDANPGGNGQDTDSNLLGSVLRIDVDAGDPYAVPDDNPLPDSPYPEQYAWGFRNPWRFSFDGEEFLVADVGQSAHEEVSLVERGDNYGWNVKEGTHCFGAETCPEETPDGAPLRDPVIEYPHGGEPVSGISVIGGHVYRGERLPGLRGRYVFADWNASGDFFVADPTGEGLWETSVLETTADFAHVLGFGRHGGESYVLTTESSGPSGESGALRRLVAAEGGNGSGDGEAGDGGSGGTTGETTESPGTPGFGAGAALLALGAAGASALRPE
jgi:glucose/arabinose dehydrogenase